MVHNGDGVEQTSSSRREFVDPFVHLCILQFCYVFSCGDGRKARNAGEKVRLTIDVVVAEICIATVECNTKLKKKTGK